MLENGIKYYKFYLTFIFFINKFTGNNFISAKIKHNYNNLVFRNHNNYLFKK